MWAGLTERVLRGGGRVWLGVLPAQLRLDAQGFEALWATHPEGFHEVQMHGRRVKTPRWQQAYGRDYRYTGNVNRALPLTPLMALLLGWLREAVDARLNGLLLNWYEGAARHYIGAHRDSVHGLVEGAPIVTLSFGEARPWRLRPWRGQGFDDVEASDGGVIVLPWETNRAYTHEVPAPAHAMGRRISVTARAFVGTSGGGEVGGGGASGGGEGVG